MNKARWTLPMTKKASDATELLCDNNTVKTHHVTWSCTGLEINSPTFLLDFIRWWAGFGKLNRWQLDWIPIIPRDLWVPPPVPTKGACRVAELAFKRFLREQIQLTQRAKGDGKKETESIARSITAALFADEAREILEKIRVNTQRIFNTTKDRQQCKFLKLVHGKQASAVSNVDHHLKLTKTNW